jgi:predicted membrane GTPase involved in stress response
MQRIRNIAIIVYVDHGKTTLVSSSRGMFLANQRESQEQRLMDSMDLERKKGVIIHAKNAAFQCKIFTRTGLQISALLFGCATRKLGSLMSGRSVGW